MRGWFVEPSLNITNLVKGISLQIIYSAICKQQCQIKNRNKWLPSFCFLVSKKRYCWWKKSCINWYGRYPVIYSVFDIPPTVTYPNAFKHWGDWLPVVFFLGGVRKWAISQRRHVWKVRYPFFFWLGVRKMWSSRQTCKNRRFPMVKQWELENFVVSSQGHKGMTWGFPWTKWHGSYGKVYSLKCCCRIRYAVLDS